jgi:beta-xylosidase
MKFLKKWQLSILMTTCMFYSHAQDIWTPDNNDGTYSNPIIYADYSDPDVCKVGDDFYMTSSSFNAVPGLPILHSKDLVNWTIINHALQPNVDAHFDIPQHGNGVWAPSIRHHNGTFYIYWGDPDRGIFMVKTKDPAGQWSAPILVKKAYGNIDACPLWDDDGKVYLVHAFAHSRAGINSTLQVVELTPEGDERIDKGKIVIDGHEKFPTLEGPKFYKRNGYYYIFAPAGGVPTGWQTVFRSKNVYGPYEDKIVLAQGDTEINGPHQGGLIELDNGQSWFIHFQDRDAYGRIVHMQPVKWVDDWPVMGVDEDGDGTGDPVLNNKKPKIKGKFPITNPQTSDEFDEATLGLQWQWSANPKPHWYTLSEGALNLEAISQPAGLTNLWMVPNILSQKIPAPQFEVVTKVDVSKLKPGEQTGLLMFGLDYAGIQIENRNNTYRLSQVECKKAFQGLSPESAQSIKDLQGTEFWLKAIVENGNAKFEYSTDGTTFSSIGQEFVLKEGRWVGSKISIFCTRQKSTGAPGLASFDWLRVLPLE